MRHEVLSVPEVSCGHCRTAIEAAVAAVAGVAGVRVDLAAKQVTVDGEFTIDAVVAAIAKVGYEVAGAA